MAEETTVELAKNGTDARVIFAKDIEIKDLWHLAMAIRKGEFTVWSEKQREEFSDDILDIWALAHHLKDHIIDKE